MSESLHPRLLLPVAIAAGALCFGAGAAWAESADAVGQPVPAFRAQALDGTEIDLGTLRGHVVVVNFWATWCPPCRAEMPILESFYRDHVADGVVMLAISADDPHDRRDVVKALGGFTFRAALLKDAKASGFQMPAALPITYVVDAQGVIRARLPPTRAGLTRQSLDAAVLPVIHSSDTTAGP